MCRAGNLGMAILGIEQKINNSCLVLGPYFRTHKIESSQDLVGTDRNADKSARKMGDNILNISQ